MSGISVRNFVWSASALGIIAVGACSARDGDDAERGESVVATPTFGAVGVPVGVALVDPRASLADRWCANFDEYALAVGDTVTLVWADSSADPAMATLTQVRSARPGRCAQLPTDTSDIDDADLGTVYELAPINGVDSAAVPDLMMLPAIAVRGSARWLRGADGFLRADLDGDENLEQARICTSNEGV
ncbi:MAG: hypothetical protein H7099_18590, partial [Gemmatimonadaceae bacterium]|nr:hypothetical protein [Gemmatimonadaceae bacterium]